MKLKTEKDVTLKGHAGFSISHYYKIIAHPEDENVLESYYAGYYHKTKKGNDGDYFQNTAMCRNMLLLLLAEIDYENVQFELIQGKENSKIEMALTFEDDDVVILYRDKKETVFVVFEGQVDHAVEIFTKSKEGFFEVEIAKFNNKAILL